MDRVEAGEFTRLVAVWGLECDGVDTSTGEYVYKFRIVGPNSYSSSGIAAYGSSR
jgi:hypothetical protein